jgi:hypothetical protein
MVHGLHNATELTTFFLMRLSDLERGERRIQEVEQHAEKCVCEAEGRTEELLRTILGIILH